MRRSKRCSPATPRERLQPPDYPSPKESPVSDIHIHREHHLGLKEARKIAFSWAEKAEEKFDMECVYEEGET